MEGNGTGMEGNGTGIARDGKDLAPSRIMVTAPSSGGGKTLFTCGLLALLQRNGCRTVSFKEGPDYIDPMFHATALGIQSRNLDPFFGDARLNRSLMARHSSGVDIAVVEGAMGYYDGIGGVTTKASSYDLALQLDMPAILVTPCKGAGASVAALVKGFAAYRRPSHLKGVVLNRVSPSYYPRMKRLIEEETGLAVLGYLPEFAGIDLRSRHLGLCCPEELPGLKERIRAVADTMEETVDVKGILRLSAEAGAWEGPLAGWACMEKPLRRSGAVVAVARDEAFCFGYEDNWELLRDLGAKLRFFSPLRDRQVPDGVNGLWLPGGYPELHAGMLGGNVSMRQSVRACITQGMPAVAECGGFLYLHEWLETQEGEAFPMAGVFPGTARPGKRLQNFGYIHLTAQRDTLLLRRGESAPCHEFHYWKSAHDGDACMAVKASQGGGWPCVRGDGPPTLFAGFPHLYLPARPEMGERFLDACSGYGS